MQPQRRTLDVAKAYVEGLERDRNELRDLEGRYDHMIWELIQISAYAKALYTALYQVMHGDVTNAARIEELLEANRQGFDEIWGCPCGHHRFDHDEDGRCEYLGCKRICSPDE